MPLKILLNCWIYSLHFVPPFVGADVALKIQNIFWVAEAFDFAVRTLSGDADTVVYHAVGYTRSAVDAQVVYDADFSGFPIQGVCGAGFYAQIAFYSPAGPHVNLHVSLFEALLDADRL